jgi:hypothetical protein
MSGGGAGGSRTTIAPTGTIDAMAMTTGDIVAIERDTATMADVMRAVTAGGDAVGIATTIDPEEQPPRQQKARRNGGLFRSTVRSARRRDARSAWSGHGRLF